MHTWIAWPKDHIRLKQAKPADSGIAASATREPSMDPPSPGGPSMDPPSPRGPSIDPPSSPGIRDPSASPPQSPAKASAPPSPPAPKQKKYSKVRISPPRPPRKQTRKKKEKEPKIPEHERPDYVKNFFKIQAEKRQPEKKEPVDPAVQQFFIKQARPVVKEPLSDYDRTITKSYKKPQNRKSVSSKKSKSIPQLGQQAQQSIPPLTVFADDVTALAKVIEETNLTAAQLLGEDDNIPTHPGCNRKPFVLGEPLVWPELLPYLGTRMYEFHEWYMKKSADGMEMFAARIVNSLYRSPADVWIDFGDIWYVYQQDAVSKSLISAWIL